jgi:hypothetical protein
MGSRWDSVGETGTLQGAIAAIWSMGISMFCVGMAAGCGHDTRVSRVKVDGLADRCLFVECKKVKMVVKDQSALWN